MNVVEWLFGRKPAPSPSDEKFDRAMRLTDEVEKSIHKVSKDPFTVIAIDLARAVFHGGADPALVADAYEARQEARIYLGEQRREKAAR